VQDEFQRPGSIIPKIIKHAAEGVLLIKGDDRKQGIARQGQVLRGVDPAMTVTIFAPLAGVTLVMVLVLDPPVASDHTRSPLALAVIISRIKAAQKLPGVALEPGPAFLKGLFVNPGARRLPGTPGIGQTSFDRTNRRVTVLTMVKSPVGLFVLF
jgi:hypothetical protein